MKKYLQLFLVLMVALAFTAPALARDNDRHGGGHRGDHRGGGHHRHGGDRVSLSFNFSSYPSRHWSPAYPTYYGYRGYYPYYNYYVAPPPVVYAPAPQAIVYTEPAPAIANQTSATYINNNGQHCREFQSTAQIAGSVQPTYGTACLQPDGAWRVVR